MDRLAAEVRSIEALEQFREALVCFGQEVAAAAGLVEAELHRVRQWIEVEQYAYWKAAFELADQRLAEARVELERAETAIRPEDRPSCHVQRKVYEQAKRRLAYCEQQIRVVKHWQAILDRELHKLAGRIGKLRDVADIDVVRAVATLDRHIQALRNYLAASAPSPGTPIESLSQPCNLPSLGPPAVGDQNSVPHRPLLLSQQPPEERT